MKVRDLADAMMMNASGDSHVFVRLPNGEHAAIAAVHIVRDISPGRMDAPYCIQLATYRSDDAAGEK